MVPGINKIAASLFCFMLANVASAQQAKRNRCENYKPHQQMTLEEKVNMVHANSLNKGWFKCWRSGVNYYNGTYCEFKIYVLLIIKKYE